MQVLARGEFNIRGLQNRTLRDHLPEKNGGQVSRLLKRLRLSWALAGNDPRVLMRSDPPTFRLGPR